VKAPDRSSSPWQRTLIGLFSLLLLMAAGAMFFALDSTGDGASRGTAASFLRMGIVLAVLWLAWPQALSKGSLAFLGIVMAIVVALAFAPKILFSAKFLLPMIGVLMLLGFIGPYLRGMMGPRR